MLSMSSLILNFFAGTISVLSPCVYPAIPFLIGSAFQEHKLGPVAVALGLVTSFVLGTVAIVTAGSILGFEQSSVQNMGAIFLILMGLLYLFPGTQRIMERTFSKFANAGNNTINKSKFSGLTGQYILGLLIGAVWSPCIGPAFGSALALAATSGSRGSGITSIIAFAIGLTTPILLMASGVRQFALKKEIIGRMNHYMKPIFGVAMIGLGLAVLSGLDKKFETAAINWMPEWVLKLITTF